MWQVTVFCSGCDEESEVVVEALDDVEREVCACGYSFVVLSVANFEPVYAEDGELIELSPRTRHRRPRRSPPATPPARSSSAFPTLQVMF